MGFFKEWAAKDPLLKRKLIMAKMNISPEEYLKKQFLSALILSTTIGLSAFLFFSGLRIEKGKLIIYTLILFIISFQFFFWLLKKSVDVKINKLAKEIDKEVLFAGRFLLVKLNSGTPLITALSQAANSYGVANQFFKDIMRDIDAGTPLEEALDKASRYSPSKNFRKIIGQISNAIKIGVDVTQFLESIIDEIAENQLIEIKRYGKKLNGLTMFYMLLSIIMPSLGITLLVTVISLLNVQLNASFFALLAFGLIIIEFIFITLFKSARPNLNI